MSTGFQRARRAGARARGQTSAGALHRRERAGQMQRSRLVGHRGGFSRAAMGSRAAPR